MKNKKSVRDFITSIAEQAPEIAASAYELIEYNEWGIALENALENLIETSVSLSEDQLKEVEKLVATLQLCPTFVENLRGLQRDEYGRPRQVIITMRHLQGPGQLLALLQRSLCFPEPATDHWSEFTARLQKHSLLPHVFTCLAWKHFADAHPRDALAMLGAFANAKRANQAAIPDLVLFSSESVQLSLRAENSRLQALLG